MLSKSKKHKRVIVFTLCVFIISSLITISLWPQKCGNSIRNEKELTFYFVTPKFSESSSLPQLTPEQWIVDSDSDKYKKILSIMDKYHCHFSICPMTQDNRNSWLTIYNSQGIPVFECRSTNEIKIGNIVYSIYGSQDNGLDIINMIHSILSS
jgi:hypothetical protein